MVPGIPGMFFCDAVYCRAHTYTFINININIVGTYIKYGLQHVSLFFLPFLEGVGGREWGGGGEASIFWDAPAAG